MYARLRKLGFSAEQALEQMDGTADDSYESAVAARTARRLETASEPASANGRRTVSVPTTRRIVNRGPRMEYFAKPIPKGRKVTIAAGNSTDVFKVLSAARGRGMTVPDIAKATGIPAHSVEASVYRLVSVDKVAGKRERGAA
jgi:hypothetical protein